MSATDPPDTVIVLNPDSGSGDHAEPIRERAAVLGYGVEESESADDATAIARRVAEAGASTIVAAGGDGTVNDVVRGIDRAEAFADVTFGILPVGTGNNFATNVGVTDLDTAFEVIETGERRRIDLGRANGRPFVNSCIAGLTAESSSETSSEMKERLGVFAYVITTLRSVSDFETLELDVDIAGSEGETTAWTGEAISVLVGNGRRFTAGRGGQADMEDGLLEVTVVENVTSLDLLGETVVEELLGHESPHVVRSRAPSLAISIRRPGSTRFSLDGEIVDAGDMSLAVDPGTLELAVGDAYDPDPD